LRQNFSKVVTSPKFYKKILVLSYLAGLATLLIIPYLLPTMGEKGFISENAVSALNPLPSFDISRVEQIQQALEKATQSDFSKSFSFIERFFIKNNVQPHTQEFAATNDKGANLYGIYRTKRGDPGECNLISFSHDLSTKNGGGKFEIAMALSFLDMFASTSKINYNSRDIIFLAYDGRFKTYGKAVKEFLNNYYGDENIGMERCGTIRQALNIEIEQDDMNKLALLYQGVNGRVPDHDYYVMITKLLERNYLFWEFQKDISFEKSLGGLLNNNYLKHVNKIYQELSGEKLQYVDATDTLVNLKGLLVGNSHEAHTYMLEKGIMAVTFKGYHCNGCRGIRSTKDALTILGETIEGANRGSQAVQEQLHAGSTYYLATTKKNIYFLLGSIALVGLLILPVVVKAVVTYYDQTSDRNLLRASWEHFGILSAMWGINKLPQILEYGWNEFGLEGSLCPDRKDGVVYDDNFVVAFLLAGLGLVLLGTLIFPLLSEKLFGPSRVKVYQAQHWKTQSALYCGYAAANLIAWSLSNAAIALLGAGLILPIFTFVSPIRGGLDIKRLVLNMVGLVWIGGLWFGVSFILQNNGLGWFDLVQEMLIKQACHGLDLYRFTTFIVIPAFIYILKILSFSPKDVVGKSD